jgi:hypothetical protein
MTARLLRRVADLEQTCSRTPKVRVVFAVPGEKAQQARKREGISPDAKALVVVIVFG